jgi:Cu(I)/Ag(I) efflux system membrane fusion protein
MLIVFAVGGSAFAGTEKFDAQMQKVVEPYLKIQELLALDSTNGVAELAKKIVAASKKLDTKTITGEHANHFTSIPSDLNRAAEELSKAKDLKSARAHFKEISQALAVWAGVSKPKDINVMYCPMAKANWLQKESKVHNPYYGQEMLSCGKIVK